jgi:hypothetical protein
VTTPIEPTDEPDETGPAGPFSLDRGRAIARLRKWYDDNYAEEGDETRSTEELFADRSLASLRSPDEPVCKSFVEFCHRILHRALIGGQIEAAPLRCQSQPAIELVEFALDDEDGDAVLLQLRPGGRAGLYRLAGLTSYVLEVDNLIDTRTQGLQPLLDGLENIVQYANDMVTDFSKLAAALGLSVTSNDGP